MSKIKKKEKSIKEIKLLINEMTIEDFNKIPPETIFACGIAINSPTGIYMTSSRLNEPLEWIAKKGYCNDWAIYCGFKEDNIDIENDGNKICNKEHINKLVNCDKEMFNRYRY